MASFSLASSEGGLSLFVVSPFPIGGSSLGSWLATLACFPFAPLFPFVYTFLSADLSFPAAFLAWFLLMQEQAQLTPLPVSSWVPPSLPLHGADLPLGHCGSRGTQ